MGSRPSVVVIATALVFAEAAFQAPDSDWAWHQTKIKCDIKKYGARGDFYTDDTKPIQAAFDDVATTCPFVFVSPGNYTVRALRVHNLDIFIDKDATLTAWPTPDGYPIGDVEIGKKEKKPRLAPLVDVRTSGRTITGNFGTIDGRGDQFWYAQASKATKPPRLISIADVADVTISKIILKNAPFWTVHAFRASRIHIHDIVVRNLLSAHTDGIDLDSSDHCVIERVDIAARDDCVAFKATDPTRTSQNHVFKDSLCSGDLGRGGSIAFGSEVQGGLADIDVRNVSVSDAAAAVLIKTKPQRGGFVLNVNLQQIRVKQTHRAILFDTNYTSPTSHRKCGGRKVSHDPDHACPRLAMERLGFPSIKPSRKHGLFPTDGPPSVKTLIGNVSFRDFDVAAGYVGFRSAGTLVGSGDVPLLGLRFDRLDVRDSPEYTPPFRGFHCCCAFGTIAPTSPSTKALFLHPGADSPCLLPEWSAEGYQAVLSKHLHLTATAHLSQNSLHRRLGSLFASLLGSLGSVSNVNTNGTTIAAL